VNLRNIKYYLGLLISLPLLPFMYLQGRRIRASVPRLAEATGPQGKVVVDSKSNRSLKIIFLGESTIAGLGVKTHEEGFAGSFAREMAKQWTVNVDWRVYARSGYNAHRLHHKILPKIEEDSADLIVIGLGGNDAFELHGPAKWRREIAALVASIRFKFPTSPIVFCNMPPIKEFPAFSPLIKFTIGNLVELLGQELKSFTETQEAVYYLDERISLKGWGQKYDLQGEVSTFFSDGVHPSRLTYQIWAEDIASWVSNNPEIQVGLQKLNSPSDETRV